MRTKSSRSNVVVVFACTLNGFTIDEILFVVFVHWSSDWSMVVFFNSIRLWFFATFFDCNMPSRWISPRLQFRTSFDIRPISHLSFEPLSAVLCHLPCCRFVHLIHPSENVKGFFFSLFDQRDWKQKRKQKSMNAEKSQFLVFFFWNETRKTTMGNRQTRKKYQQICVHWNECTNSTIKSAGRQRWMKKRSMKVNGRGISEGSPERENHRLTCNFSLVNWYAKRCTISISS